MTDKKQPFNFTGEMTELERKFIIMARISVALNRKGLVSSVTINPDMCDIFVHTGDDNRDVLDYVCSRDSEESDLLAWWSEIENNVE